MAKVSAYLRLARAQTAPLEIAPAIVGAILAGGGYVAVFLWGVYGALYHFAGYSMNSYSDWKNGYDKSDPNKQHHPLNTGEITPPQAEKAVKTMFLTALFYAGALCVYYESFIGIAIMATGVLAGVAYNELGKMTLMKPVLISIAHSTVFLLPYSVINGSGDVLGWAGSGAVFMWVFYQITISGEVKDLDTDEKNFLLSFGADYTEWWNQSHNVMSNAVNRTVYIPFTLSFYAAWVRVVYATVVVVTALRLGMEAVWIAVILSIGAITALLSVRLTRNGAYERDSRLRTMSLIEIGSFSMFVMLTLPATSITTPLLLISLSAIYLIVTNRVLWGTYIAPEV